MARILIDARCIADPLGGGVTRVAKLWINERLNDHEKLKTKDAESSHGHPEFISGSNTNPPSIDEVFLFTTGTKPSATVKEYCQQNNFKYLHLRIPNKLWTLTCILGLSSLTKTAEKQIGQIDRLLLPNLAFMGQLHRPYELLLHDLSFMIEPHWFSWRRRWWHYLLPVTSLIRGAKTIHCVSEQTQRDVLRLTNIPAEKTTIFVFNPKLAPIQPNKPSWLPDNLGGFALIMGSNDPRKNVCTVLSAITAFNLKHKDAPLVPIVLGGPVKKSHNPYSLSCLYALGKVTDAELAYLYTHATVFLYPSWYEGFGLPLHEAHQYNTPNISSTAGALPETAPSDTLFCHPAKPHEWLMAIEYITEKNIINSKN